MKQAVKDTYMARIARFTRRRDEWQAKIDETEAKLNPPKEEKPKKKSSKKKKAEAEI